MARRAIKGRERSAKINEANENKRGRANATSKTQAATANSELTSRSICTSLEMNRVSLLSAAESLGIILKQRSEKMLRIEFTG